MLLKWLRALEVTSKRPIPSTMASSKVYRDVVKKVPGRGQSEGQGATVFRSIGTQELRNLDPFLMLDEFRVSYPAGFPDHPHRGFETVTYMLEGSNQHEDFAGHHGTIGPGDLQWMTAGKGIVHAEMPLSKDPNQVAKGLQLWINLPAKEKMCEPKYQEMLDREIPRVFPSPGVEIKVMAGETHGVQSPVYTTTPVTFLDFKLSPGKEAEQALPSSFETAFLYIISGEALVGPANEPVAAHTTVVFSKSTSEEESIVRVQTLDKSVHFVLVAGKPLNEPIVQHGPFVMNHRDQIQATFTDYQRKTNGFERASGWKSSISEA